MSSDRAGGSAAGAGENGSARGPSEDLLARLIAQVPAGVAETLGRAEGAEGSIGMTMFDLPSSEDGTIDVLLPKDRIAAAPSQALVRIASADGREYLGIVTAGPFAEPNALRADSAMLKTIQVQQAAYVPPYHGRVAVSLLGERQRDGSLGPPRLRPLPNSPVFALSDEASAAVLQAAGGLRLGLAVGYEQLPVGIPPEAKAVLPRHLAVLGTTGSGKSTTIARLICEAQAAGMAVIVLDVEGEYTCLNEPTADLRMLTGLAERGLAVGGVPTERLTIYHLVGRDTANPDFPNCRPFSLQFARLSPYAAAEILELTDAQVERFIKAYDIAKLVLRDLKVFPDGQDPDQERLALEVDEFERGYPRLTLQMLIDVTGHCADRDRTDWQCRSQEWLAACEQSQEKLRGVLKRRIEEAKPPGNIASWNALLGKLARLNRLRVFDRDASRPGGANPLSYRRLLQPGAVSIVDLSDVSMSELSNIVIADLLRGVQEAQDDAYERYERAQRAGASAEVPARVLVIVEEAHEFLGAERLKQMPVLFEQVARIAKRGRKRWLGLVFVTQLPQHLPRQVFGLVNSYILHKIADPDVVSTLQRTVGGLDESLARKLPNLAPGQAVVACPHLTRPLLVSIDPTPAKLRLID